ncbi:MAG: ATP-grasp domain-containing protein, partial [Acidobacteria bacterium]|nr:ATP-grasp domain-containing protein [Acidobacteriota bacterium]
MEPVGAVDVLRVNVPDATNRAALAVIRSLGRHGCRVVVGRPREGALGAASRFAAAAYEHPDPAHDPEGFAARVGRASEELDAPAILPTADIPTYALLEHRAALPAGIRLLAPPEEALAIAHDKVRLVELATSLGVPVPDGFRGDSGAASDPRLERLGFPLVLKPAVSRYCEGGAWHGASVRVVADREGLSRALATGPEFGAGRRFLVQARVPGEGRGVFVLAHEGRVRCVFAHRRLREKPPWGGVSTLCEVSEPEPLLVEHARRLIEALGWTGVAMVEFKYDPATGRAWLMEINGRFWGSIQLAIAAGVDFPWLYVRQQLAGIAPEPVGADPRWRLWWLLGDFDHFLIRLKRGGVSELPRAAGDALWRTRGGHRLDLDTLAWDDPRPFL